MTEASPPKASAERLRTARSMAGFPSAAAAARHFGWSEGAYRHHENGTRSFGISQAQQYAKAYSVPLTWLLSMIGATDTTRLPVARFYIQVYADLIGEGSSIWNLVDSMYEQLGLSMVPELNVDVNSFAWIKGPDGIPPFHFVSAAEIGASPEVMQEGFIFAYRVPRRAPLNQMAIGDLVYVDSSILDVGTKPELWLMRDDVSPFIKWAHITSTGEITLLSTSAKEPSTTLSDQEINVVGRVIWVGRRL